MKGQFRIDAKKSSDNRKVRGIALRYWRHFCGYNIYLESIDFQTAMQSQQDAAFMGHAIPLFRGLAYPGLDNRNTKDRFVLAYQSGPRERLLH